MWPTALANLGIDLKGKIAEGASEGRAVARLTDLGHGQALRELFAPATEDGPVPVPLVKAVIEVLGDWRPGGRRDRRGRVRDPADAHRRPRRRALPLPPGPGGRAGTPIVDPTSRPGQGAMNSAQRVAAVGRRFSLEADEAALKDSSVLLVDDLVVTGWTLTLAARAIRGGRRGRRAPPRARASAGEVRVVPRGHVPPMTLTRQNF